VPDGDAHDRDDEAAAGDLDEGARERDLQEALAYERDPSSIDTTT